jgi:hypothetical protein
MRRTFLAAVVIGLWSSSALAAQRVWITEFSSLASASGSGTVQIGRLPAVARQQLDVTAGAQTSNAFNQSTNFIRVICEVQCAIRGDGVTATSNDLLMVPFGAEYFGITPGSTISVIAAP